MNIKKSFPLLFIVSSLLFLVSCGGDSGSQSPLAKTTTGQFIDDQVWGLDYSCSSGATGITNLHGEYTCNTGDDVTFSIGPVTLGTLSAQSAFVTPYSLFPNDPIAAVNLAMLLQSLDSDSNPNNNVITLDPAQLSQLPADTDFTNPNFVADIEAALGITLIDTMTAMNHLNDAIILNGGSVPNGGHIPVAHAGSDTSIVVENSITLDGDTSSDADGDSLTFSWSIVSSPAGSVISALTDPLTSTPTLTPAVVGEYVIQLIVNDGVVNSAADMVTITATANDTPSDSPPSFAWVKELRVESSGGQDGGIALDSDNNLYMAANTLIDFGDDINAGGRDILIIKYNADGDIQWSDLTGTTAEEFVTDIAFDQTRNALYLVGHTSLSLHDQPAIGDRDIFLIKYDTAGNRLWTIMDGTITEDHPFGIALDSAGNILIAGYTFGNFGDNAQQYAGRDIFVAKYDSDGNKIWTRQVHGDSWEWAHDVAVDSNDNIYITGYTASSDLNGQTPDGTDSFIIKYDNNGNSLWTRLISSPGTEYGNAITTDSNNNIFVTGQTSGDLGGETNHGGNADQFVVKYSANGALIWTTLSGGALTDFGSDIVVDSSGRIYTTGGTEKTEIGDRYDYVLTMFAADGEELWTIQDGPEYGSNRDNQGHYLALDSVKNIYIHGWHYGSYISTAEANSNKVFVAKYENNNPTGGPYTVGGTVITYSPTGQITADLVLTNNGGDNLTISGVGSFTFATPLSDGASYHVEILDSGDAQECTIESGGSNDDGSGTIDGADVTDIVIECHPV